MPKGKYIRTTETKKKIINCIYCGKKVEYYPTTSPNRKFCSLSCSTSYMNKSRPSRKITVSCKKCGKIFKCFPCQKRIYCSRKCCTKWGSESVMWNGGNSVRGYPQYFYELRKKIRKRDNYTCQECGKPGKNLDVHHIDYNKKNNNPSNLITLCRSCHLKTNFKRKDWTEYFKCQSV